MIDIKATTNENGVTSMEISVAAKPIEYMAEVVSIIESLMRGLKENDVMLHAAVLKIIADNPQILLGREKGMETRLAEMMSKSIIEKGAN